MNKEQALAEARDAIKHMGTELPERLSGLYTNYAHVLVTAFLALDEAGAFAALDEEADTLKATAMLAEATAQSQLQHHRGVAPQEALQVLHNTWQRHRRHGRRDPLAEQPRETGYAAASRLGSLERVPGTDTLRPARQEALPEPDEWAARARAIESLIPKGSGAPVCTCGADDDFACTC